MEKTEKIWNRKFILLFITNLLVLAAFYASTPIIPIYTYEATRTLQMAKRLYEAGVYVNPVLPPATPATECLLRTSYMATLTEALLDEALDIFERVLKGHGEA